MEAKETSLRPISQDEMLKDTEYYRFIFKKTEKMVCAVFYILRSNTYNSQNDQVVLDIEDTSMALLETSLQTLRSTKNSIEGEGNDLKHALIEFEAKLRIANAIRLIGTDLLEVFTHEIDSVLRALRKYTEPTISNPLVQSDTIAPVSVLRTRKPSRISTEGVSAEGVVHPQGISRRERVLTVLRDKGEATIKDIVEVVTDCSEKTIQRELISLIKDNKIVREGERRWSKYRII